MEHCAEERAQRPCTYDIQKKAWVQVHSPTTKQNQSLSALKWVLNSSGNSNASRASIPKCITFPVLRPMLVQASLHSWEGPPTSEPQRESYPSAHRVSLNRTNQHFLSRAWICTPRGSVFSNSCLVSILFQAQMKGQIQDPCSLWQKTKTFPKLKCR